MTTDEPAVNGWQAATEAHMARSTSAGLRKVTAELDRLREQYDAVLLERDELAAERAKWAEALIEARAEVKRLTTRHARAYQLTDKGRAATEETDG